MNFSISQLSILESSANWLLLGITANTPLSTAAAEIDAALGGVLTRLREREDLTGKLAEVTILPEVPQLAADRVLVVGLGEADKLTLSTFAKAISTATRTIASKENQTLCIAGFPSETLFSLGEAALLERLADSIIVSCASQGIYKKETDRYPLAAVEVFGIADNDENTRALQRGKILGTAVNLTRELVNRHPDDIYPESFAQRAADEAAELGIRGEILDEHMLADERMGALLAVAKGSDRPPRMVVLKYQGAGKDAPTLGLVGKGVTFDSGGLSLKPSPGMITMKSDMAGAATVLGTMHAIAKLKLPVNVIGYMGLVENMTGGSAYKLGSVVTARNGKTIEIHNTDAEGRLVLADVLAFAVDDEVDTLIDLATLTGACVVALGEDIVGAFSNDQNWCDSTIASSQAVGELVWQLPMHDFFADQLKSDFADCKNVGSRWGGAITAAKFLEQFVGDVPWVHLDIAGPSYAESGSAHRDAGGTGVMVRTLVKLAEQTSAAVS